jgi:hypothetical protein
VQYDESLAEEKRPANMLVSEDCHGGYNTGERVHETHMASRKVLNEAEPS